MPEPQSTAVLVAGMHRSGTSALAGVLSKLGIPLGDRLLEPAGDNPKGYWEHQDVVMVHERLLAGLGSRWDDVRALPDNWLESEPARHAAAAIDEIITRDFLDKSVWAVKDPRLCRTLPLWFEVLSKHETRPVVLFMVRKPSEVSASIETRNCWRPLVGKLLWLRYMTEAVAASRDVSRGVVLYEDLLMDPVSTVTTALSLLGTPVGQGLSPEGREAVAGFVDISDRHHTNPDSEESPTVFDTLAGELYESLVGVARGSKRWNAVEQATEAVDREWRRSGACVDAVADMAARIEAGMQEAKVEKQRVTSALNAQISWSEEAQAKLEALQVDNAELSSKFNAQIRWSEEAQAKLEALQVDNAELSSKFNAQIRWSEEAQAKLEALQVDNAELSSKFNAQVRWSEEAQAKLEVLQAQNAELFARLVEKTNEHERVKSDSDRWQEESRNLSARLQQMVAEAAQVREKMAALEAQLQNATAERDQIAAQLEQVRINHLATEAELREVYSSTSWKSTKLLRAAARIFRHEIGPADSSTRKPE